MVASTTAMLIITLVSRETKELVNFMSALNCAQMEINTFASVETLDNQQLDVVFEGLTDKQQKCVLETFEMNNTAFTYAVN
ncbi:hypothetical protein [Photobacterium damselae]|uniref:hypothetical protein n=1 Tax=Photobacterium damselae TaxID=38293 RepID=UPI001F46318B|nr:hypothetical protein [Photobacterium damselae]UKA04866.1 hypothetical protein IHC89_21725 [Photobacterium damselae subsp. damselae]